MRRGGPLRRRGRREGAAEKRARLAFEEAVLAKGGCVLSGWGQPCSPRLDAHHIIPKQYLRQRPGKTREERLALVWNPDNGVPICRKHHNFVTIAALRLRADQLRPENIEFAAEHGLEGRLEREVPGFVMPEAFGVQRTEDGDGK